MTTNEKAQVLKRFDLFKGLTDGDLEIIAKLVEEKVLTAKTILIEQEANPDFAYFIFEGGAKVYRLTENGEEITLSLIGPNEIVGEMALIDEGLRSATVETIQDTKILVLSKRDFRTIIEKKPSISFHLLLILSERVRKLSATMEDIISKKLDARALKTLQLLSKYFPNSEVLLSHEELAQIIGATRSRVTEVLNKLANEGQIEISHKKIKVL